MTRYRCIEEFVAHKVDGNGSETGECYLVEADSLWNLDRGAYCIYGQNRLENDDILGMSPSWIEISDEALERYFEVG